MKQLAEQNHVAKLDAGLGWREQELRRIYALPRARTWMVEELPLAVSNWNLETSPVEQVSDLFRLYCAGETLWYERQFRPVRHIEKGIWELKTADIRLFGWFQAKDCFVCTGANTALNVKEYSLYAGYRDEAVRLREQLDLDEPKFVAGDDPNDVISNFC